MADAPVSPRYSEMLRGLAKGIDDVLNGEDRKPGEPKQIGFALFMFEFGKADDGRVNYVSNADRAEMLTAVREWLARAEGRVVEPETKQ